MHTKLSIGSPLRAATLDPHGWRAEYFRPLYQRVFENRQVRASRLVMVVIMARWTMASWWSGLVS